MFTSWACTFDENCWNMRDGYDIGREEMVPFFSIASRDFEGD